MTYEQAQSDQQVQSVSVVELLDEISREGIGIPHFQRGQVWNEQLQGRLLDSMYLGTPCGLLIFWKPEAPQKHARRSVDGAGNGYQRLLIDGQQRVATLQQVLAPLRTTAAVQDERWPQWCVWLNKLPELRERLGVFQVADGLFTFDTPVKRGKRQKYLLPLSYFSLATPEHDRAARLEEALSEICGPANLNEISPLLIAHMNKGLFERHFPFVELIEIGGQNTLKDVVDVYVRINSAGKRVDPEERAFAMVLGLPALGESVSEGVKQLFELVHPSRGGADTGDTEEWLRRTRESTFGFKAYLRILAHVCFWHFGLDRDLESLDIAADEDLVEEISRVQPDDLKQLWTVTHELVEYLAHNKTGLLRKDLFCDDLRFFPASGLAALEPVIRLLLRFPKLMDPEYRQAMAATVIRLLLDPPKNRASRRERREAVSNNVDAASSHKALLATLVSKKEKALAQQFIAVDTVQSSETNLLYMLLRKQGAADFSCEANKLNPENSALLQEQAKRVTGLESKVAPVCAGVNPEKQHIVPFSKFKKEGEKRVSRHPAHSTGNITFISQMLNGFQGLSDRTMNIDHEDAANLDAHFLRGETKKALQRCFEVGSEERSYAQRELDEAFEKFVGLRCRSIAKGWTEWLDQLERNASPMLFAGLKHAAPRRLYLVDRVLERYHASPSVVGGIPLCFYDLDPGFPWWYVADPKGWNRERADAPKFYFEFGRDKWEPSAGAYGFGFSVEFGWFEDEPPAANLERRRECLKEVRETLFHLREQLNTEQLTGELIPKRISRSTRWIILHVSFDRSQLIEELVRQLKRVIDLASEHVDPVAEKLSKTKWE